jgi:hypothetical protein
VLDSLRVAAPLKEAYRGAKAPFTKVSMRPEAKASGHLGRGTYGRATATATAEADPLRG